MIEVDIPSDICKYETKFIGPFTLRQTICVSVALVTVFPAYLFLSHYFIQKVSLLLCMIASTPFILCGFVKPYDMPFEKYVKVIFNSVFLYPTKRKYIIKNIYEGIFEDDNVITLQEKATKKEKTSKKVSTTKIKQVSADPDLFCCS